MKYTLQSKCNARIMTKEIVISKRTAIQNKCKFKYNKTRRCFDTNRSYIFSKLQCITF